MGLENMARLLFARSNITYSFRRSRILRGFLLFSFSFFFFFSPFNYLVKMMPLFMLCQFLARMSESVIDVSGGLDQGPKREISLAGNPGSLILTYSRSWEEKELFCSSSTFIPILPSLLLLLLSLLPFNDHPPSPISNGAFLLMINNYIFVSCLQ